MAISPSKYHRSACFYDRFRISNLYKTRLKNPKSEDGKLNRNLSVTIIKGLIKYWKNPFHTFILKFLRLTILKANLLALWIFIANRFINSFVVFNSDFISLVPEHQNLKSNSSVLCFELFHGLNIFNRLFTSTCHLIFFWLFVNWSNYFEYFKFKFLLDG